MDNGMLSIIDFLSLACGVYALYIWYRLQAVGRLFDNSLLIPRDQRIKDCIDPDGYIRYIKPRLLVLGLLLVLYGAISLANSSLKLYNDTVGMILNGIMLLIIIWYAVCTRKAFKRFW